MLGQNHTNSSLYVMPMENQVSCGIMGLCFLLGIPGNITVVVVILRNFKKDNFTLQLMLNLAASDILCLLTLPTWIYNLLTDWSLSVAFCQLTAVVVYVSVYCSLMTVTLMSVQRYFAVLYSHQWARLGRRGEKTLLLSVWILACILSSPAAVTFVVEVKNGKLECDPYFSSDGQRIAVHLCEVLMGFLVPFSILTTSYCCLHKRVNEMAFFSNKRLTRLVTNIVATFLICWIPLHIVNVINVFAICLKSSYKDASASLFDFSGFAEKVAISLVFVNSCVNPFLYAFSFQSLRQSTEDSSGE